MSVTSTELQDSASSSLRSPIECKSSLIKVEAKKSQNALALWRGWVKTIFDDECLGFGSGDLLDFSTIARMGIGLYQGWR